VNLDDATQRCARRHTVLGWRLLLVFLTLGIALELLHGLKFRLYLDVANETRRLMWTLAHAHGTLLGLVHLAFAAGVRAHTSGDPPWRRRASRCLTLSSVLLPVGFFLGGIVVHGSDPWVGVVLVPIGAFVLLAGVAQAARGFAREGR
jgi:peptidoglycan/LPS O-acetylase OafA/YrhL